MDGLSRNDLAGFGTPATYIQFASTRKLHRQPQHTFTFSLSLFLISSAITIDLLTMAHHHMSPLFRLLTPLLQSIRSSTSTALTSTLRQHALSTPSTRHISTTSPMFAGGSGGQNKGKPKKDPRITLIRYHLQHPKTPRPLRFSRMRALRHWTIHRAWMLFRRKKAAAEELELQRYEFYSITSPSSSSPSRHCCSPDWNLDWISLWKTLLSVLGLIFPLL